MGSAWNPGHRRRPKTLPGASEIVHVDARSLLRAGNESGERFWRRCSIGRSRPSWKASVSLLKVKSEAAICGVLRGDDPPVVVIGELKLSFNLELVLQGVDRAVACDEVWLAARLSTRERGRERDARFRNLCRRLGFGLLGVRSNGEVELLVSSSAPMPRKNPRRRSRLIEEHRRRRGDPVEGGGSRAPIMTAYRQHALTCAAATAQARNRRARPRKQAQSVRSSCRP